MNQNNFSQQLYKYYYLEKILRYVKTFPNATLHDFYVDSDFNVNCCDSAHYKDTNNNIESCCNEFSNVEDTSSSSSCKFISVCLASKHDVWLSCAKNKSLKTTFRIYNKRRNSTQKWEEFH